MQRTTIRRSTRLTTSCWLLAGFLFGGLSAAMVTAGEFESLFNGTDLSGWEHSGNWDVVDGVITRIGSGGDLTYGRRSMPDDFELTFEWKVAPGSNSGVYYRPGQYEYQILDNKQHQDGKNPRTSAASLYFCMPPSRDVTKPPGEWNTGRVICQAAVIQHWLNGEKVVSFDYNDPQWQGEVELWRMRGADPADRDGKLRLQDHGDPVWYHNISLRALNADEQLDVTPVTPAEVPPDAKVAEQDKARRILKGSLGGRPLKSPVITALYQRHTAGYHTYRIPGLLVTNTGSVLAFCEGRKDGPGDHGDIDLLVRRSDDGGFTFAPQQLVYEEGGSAKVTIGNPCPVVDQATGMIWMAFCRDNKDVLITSSSDDGMTWTRPLDITPAIKPDEWGWIATGPGHGIQLLAGQHAGRLVIPCDCGVIKGRANWESIGYSYVIYSDDHGQTWQRGNLAGPGMNECEVAERKDGTLLLSMRNYHKKNLRAFSVSTDGGQIWTTPEHEPQVYCPTCQSSLHRDPTSDGSQMFYSGPAGPGRSNLTLRVSRDGGASWPEDRLLHAGPAAYSDLAVLPDGTILCLYEASWKNAYDELRLARIPPDWVTAERDR